MQPPKDLENVGDVVEPVEAPQIDPKNPQDMFGVYSQDPTPETLNGVMRSLQPVISQAMSNVGEANNPMLEERAKMYTIAAVKKYDPQYGASLHTWVRQQLMQLRRAKREMNSPIKVPERIQIDAYHLKRKETEFFEKHGRDPDVHELADISHLPVKRIAKIRDQFMKVPTSKAVPDDAMTKYQPDYLSEAMEYLYMDSERLDRKIMEHRMGYGGASILPNQDLAAQLGIRPDALSKRFKRLDQRLSKTYETLKKTYE